MFCILNNSISNIDFDKEVVTKYANGKYKCKCTNTSTLKGFEDWDEEHLVCRFCGRIFNKYTLVITRGVSI